MDEYDMHEHPNAIISDLLVTTTMNGRILQGVGK